VQTLVERLESAGEPSIIDQHVWRLCFGWQCRNGGSNRGSGGGGGGGAAGNGGAGGAGGNGGPSVGAYHAGTGTQVIAVADEASLATIGSAGTTGTGAFQNVSGLGTSGQVLTSNGAAAAPTWQAIIPSGTKMLFQQTAAPTGWTKDTTHDNKALRVVTGSAGSGGTVAFSTAFASRTVSGNVDNFTAAGTIGGHALTVGQLPSHQHFISNETNSASTALSASNYVNESAQPSSSNGYILKGGATAATIGLSSSVGSGETHTHSFTGTAHNHSFSTTLDMAVQYVDLIIATKN
jgi:hypothetical protein